MSDTENEGAGSSPVRVGQPTGPAGEDGFRPRGVRRLTEADLAAAEEAHLSEMMARATRAALERAREDRASYQANPPTIPRVRDMAWAEIAELFRKGGDVATAAAMAEEALARPDLHPDARARVLALRGETFALMVRTLKGKRLPAADEPEAPETAAPEEARPRARRPNVPIPQATFPEAHLQAYALADGPGFHNWQEAKHEEALIHQAPGHAQYTRLVPGPLLAWFHLPATKAALRQELEQAGFPAAVLYLTTLGLLLEDRYALVERPLDDLILATKGRPPHGTREREKWRREYWRWLLLFESLTNPCKRPSRHRDPETGEVIETLSEETFFRVFGHGRTQLALDNSEPPVTVTIGLVPKIERLLDRHEILTRFGDMRAICGIPDGKPSGAWARAMGAQLRYLFRVRAVEAPVKRQGEEHLPAVPMRFTRKQVLVFVAVDVEGLLAGPNPERAREYWDGAIDFLLPPKRAGDKRAGILAGKPSEVDKPPQAWESWRKGWQRFWYEEQRLEFRPGPDGVGAILEVKEGAKRARARRPRRIPR